MKPKALLFGFFATALTWPAIAAAPPFETPAPVAFMKDLSSGAILYATDPDRRIPPASMATLMTTHIAFQLVKRGELMLDPDRKSVVEGKSVSVLRDLGGSRVSEQTT